MTVKALKEEETQEFGFPYRAVKEYRSPKGHL
jgi:hypothetical protein